jgi:hypothetical protein
VTGNTYGPPSNGGVTFNGRCAGAPGNWNFITPVTISGTTTASAGRNAAVVVDGDALALGGFAVVVTGATRRFACTAGSGARAGRSGSVRSEAATDEVAVVAAVVVVASAVVVVVPAVLVASAVVVVAALLSVGAGVVVAATSVVVATDVVTAVVVTTSGLGTVSGGKGVSSAPTRSGTASARLATASHAPATTARRNLGIAHTYHARPRTLDGAVAVEMHRDWSTGASCARTRCIGVLRRPGGDRWIR